MLLAANVIASVLGGIGAWAAFHRYHADIDCRHIGSRAYQQAGAQ